MQRDCAKRRVHNPSTFRRPVRFSGRHFVNNFFMFLLRPSIAFCATRAEFVHLRCRNEGKKETKECPVAFWFGVLYLRRRGSCLRLRHSNANLFGGFSGLSSRDITRGLERGAGGEGGGSVNPRVVRRRCERISREKRRKQAIETKTKQRWWKQQSSARGRRTAEWKAPFGIRNVSGRKRRATSHKLRNLTIDFSGFAEWNFLARRFLFQASTPSIGERYLYVSLPCCLPIESLMNLAGKLFFVFAVNCWIMLDVWFISRR